MEEIKCPKCGEVFQIDETSYAAIVKQVRDTEFEKEIRQRETAFATEKQTAVMVGNRFGTVTRIVITVTVFFVITESNAA